MPEPNLTEWFEMGKGARIPEWAELEGIRPLPKLLTFCTWPGWG